MKMVMEKMRFILLGTLLCVCTFAAAPKADISADDISKALPAELKHPYLYFSECDKPVLKQLVESDPVCKRIYDGLKEKCDWYLKAEEIRKPDILALAFVYQMTDDKRYAQKAFELLADEYPAPGGYFDLNSSRKCRALAPLYDWLYTGLSDEQRSHLRSGLEQQVNLIRGKYDVHHWTKTYNNNWNLVCSSGLGVAAAALVADDPALTDVMAKC
jgi:hypothetical protein